jgi:integrase
MSRRSKGPRFWLHPARLDSAGKITHAATWLILDTGKRVRTGLGADASDAEKDAALKKYLIDKHMAAVSIGSRDPSQVHIADVIARYARDKDPPYETGLRLRALLAFWGDKKLSAVNGDACREYASTRTPGAARRELEDFRAAINHHRREGLHDRIVSVVLPPKSHPKEDYLTRQEAAALIWHAWRYRERQNLRATDRATRKHVARFMVVARYMGSRAGVICEASIEHKRPEGRAWVNLSTGMFYGLPQGRRQSKKRRQLVKVPLPLLAHMRRWRARGQSYVVEWHSQPVLKVRKAHDACVAAVLERHVSPHIWRHTVATWLMQNGADRHEAAGFLAMSPDTLERVYGHHHPDHGTTVMEALKRSRFRSR